MSLDKEGLELLNSSPFFHTPTPLFSGLRGMDVLGSSPGRVTRGMKYKKRAGVLVPALGIAFSGALALGVLVGPYLAVDLLNEGLAVLMVLLELAHLLKLLGGEALYPLGDLRDAQPF